MRNTLIHHSSLRLLSGEISWLKLWDIAREHGIPGTKSIREILKLTTKPTFGDQLCPFCGDAIPSTIAFADHVGEKHLNCSMLKYLENADEKIFEIGRDLKHLLATSTSLPP